jgi:hypothetical protein
MGDASDLKSHAIDAEAGSRAAKDRSASRAKHPPAACRSPERASLIWRTLPVATPQWDEINAAASKFEITSWVRMFGDLTISNPTFKKIKAEDVDRGKCATGPGNYVRTVVLIIGRQAVAS